MPAKRDVRGNLFIYTEIVRCGQIGTIALRSFFAHHPGEKVHVYGMEADREAVKEFPDVIFHSLDRPDMKLEPQHGLIDQVKVRLRFYKIARNFDHGHLGTASLWAYLIQTRPEDYIIHFDSDVVFRGAAVEDVISKLEEGYDLVGPVRNYKNNPHGDDEKRSRPDVTQTYCFGYNKTKISPHPYNILVEMCRGGFNPLGFAVIDFFDPVGFEIQHNGGRVAMLPVDDFGGEDPQGGRKNKFPDANAIVDFGNKIAHFSGVGSGMNFFRNPEKIKGVPHSYVDHGLRRYTMYMKLFYQTEIMKTSDMADYAPLFKVKDWY